jgi:ATP-dependent Clp protease ATP-binding subunit ClpC
LRWRVFEKLTERARKVIGLARQEAQRLNSEVIGTEHILLGIIQEGGAAAVKVLNNLSVDLKRIRQEIEKLITPSTSPTVTLGQLPFSPGAKHVIELAVEAAGQVGHNVVGTEHYLLGLLKENQSIAAQVLTKLGLQFDQVRDMVPEVLRSGGD